MGDAGFLNRAAAATGRPFGELEQAWGRMESARKARASERDHDRAALADYARQLGCTCAYLKPYYDVKHELRCTLHTPEEM